MSAFQKPHAGAILDYRSTRSLHDAGSYSAYSQSPYVTTPLVPSPMADQESQISDCVPYLPNHEYASSYEESQSPMLSTRRQLPDILSYSPQRGGEGTRVFVQMQSPYDLHSSIHPTLHLAFGSNKCESTPHFLGFQGSSFQYALSVHAPAWQSTGCPSFAVPLQVSVDTHNEYPTMTLQVGVYTYEQAPQPSPSGSSRKRKLSSFSEKPISHPAKRSAGPSIPKIEPQDSYRPASYSPYMQPLPAMSGFVTPFHAASPRAGSVQYSTGSTTQQHTIRAPSPLTPAWSPSYVPVSSDSRHSGLAVTQGLTHHNGPSSVRSANPTLIRTSTLQQSSTLSHNPSFNPYAMYPSKAVLKLNGDLEAMAEGWTKEEFEAQRRLVQFARSQTGSTIHGDFKPVTLDTRTPNSICISCIYWGKRKECYVTSVDTIYLLESLVAVRFTVEEKNRIRRNLEGFRPLTVSKAKQESEDFFKTIMGFPAPKPRNIEKDVKVFPWRILGHALKKIIGKYSASYSSTAGALPTPITTYTSHGTGSDSSTEPHATASPQSASDSGPTSTYTTIAVPTYASQADHSCSQLSAAPEIRSVLPAAGHSYASVGSYSYPAICQPQHAHSLSAPTPRAAWDLHGLGASMPTTGTSTNTCYSYLDPIYSLHDTAHGP